MELETKAGINDHGHEIKTAFEDFLGGFEALKQANDERLKGLERRAADRAPEVARGTPGLSAAATPPERSRARGAQIRPPPRSP